jgi:uridylate kinase
MAQLIQEPPIVISVGGSLIAPTSAPDVAFLEELNTFIRFWVTRGKRFFLVAGGGKVARVYRDAGKDVIGTLTDTYLDWLGIHATHLNGHLLRTIFSDIAHPRVIQHYDRKLKDWKEPVVIGAGWRPGSSTDYVAVLLARDYGAQTILNLSNIDYVYTADPKKDTNAIKHMTWEELEKFVGTEWKPGMNSPFDPVASSLAKKLMLRVVVTDGKDFKNLHNIMENIPYKGTVVEPQVITSDYFDSDYFEGKKGEYPMSVTSGVGKLLLNTVSGYRAAMIKLNLNPTTVLDVGCGTGNFVKYLRKLGVDAYGVDVSEKAIELADPEVRPFLRVANSTKLPYEDGQFDVVTTFDVLEHVNVKNLKKVVNEANRVAKKHIIHKIYTTRNGFITKYHKRDFSHTSVFPQKWWQKFFLEMESVVLSREHFFHLPAYFESIFWLKKK